MPVIYDIENVNEIVFVYGEYNIETKIYNQYTISKYKDEREQLKIHLLNLEKDNIYQVGFNNLEYDYPMIHYLMSLMNKGNFSSLPLDELLYKLAEKNKQLIPNDKEKKKNKFGRSYNKVYNERINQIDLFKLHHFDNEAKRTSLKKLEINMRFPNVEEFNWVIINKDNYTIELENKLCKYNINDVNATLELYYITRGMLDKTTVSFPGMKEHYNEDKIKFRIELSNKYGVNMLSYNDVKIGEEINKLTYLKVSGRTWEEIKDKRTPREYIYIKDLIADYIDKYYKAPELIKLLNILKNEIIDINKPSFSYEFVYVNNKWSFGLGGIHTADKGRVVVAGQDEYFEEEDVGLINWSN